VEFPHDAGESLPELSTENLILLILTQANLPVKTKFLKFLPVPSLRFPGKQKGRIPSILNLKGKKYQIYTNFIKYTKKLKKI